MLRLGDSKILVLESSRPLLGGGSNMLDRGDIDKEETRYQVLRQQM